MKRVLVAFLAIMLILPVFAIAEVASCFCYVLEGANTLYGDEIAMVYEQPDTQSSVVGTIDPGQHLHVDLVDRDTGWAYVYFLQDDRQKEWVFPDNCPKGWLETKYLVFFGFDLENTYVITTDRTGERLNMRAEPDSKSLSQGKYYAGAVVRSLGKTKNGFMRVRAGHLEGYMDVRFLKKGMEYEINEMPILTVSNSGGTGVNIRKMPKKNSEVILTAPNGARITVLSVRDDGWYQIMYENEIGFARADLMKPRLEF